MALIVNEITSRAFELIRNRIGEIIIDELANQSAISYDEDIDATVYVERVIPFNSSELPAVNVMLSRGNYDNENILQKDGHYSFSIDAWTKAKTTNSNTGDILASINLQKILGVIDAILSDHQYNTLGFAPPFISNTHVDTIAIADPKRNDDGNHIMMGRLTFIVRAPDDVETLEANLIDGYDTQVKIGETDQGYIYSGDNIPVPDPTCEAGEVRDSAGLVIGEAPSGGYFVVNDSPYEITDTYGTVLYSGGIKATQSLDQQIQDSVISNSDDSYSENVLAEDTLDLPDSTVSNSDDSYYMALPATADLDLPDITHTDSDLSPVTLPAQEPMICTPAGGWQRNPDWIAIPDVTASDERFVGLFLVFENDINETTFQVAAGQTIDWGDGSPTTLTNGTVQAHQYDYTTVTGDINQLNGMNYKQVIVSVTPTSGVVTAFWIDRNGGIATAGSVNNYVDISFSWATTTSFIASVSQRRLSICERLRVYSLGDANITTHFQNMQSLSVFEFPWGNTFTNVANAFKWMSAGTLDIGDMALNSTITNLSSSFNGANLRSVGDITGSFTATAASLFNDNYTLQSVGDITLSGITSFSTAFRDCTGLKQIGDITIAACTNITTMFYNCYALKVLKMYSLGNVTTTTNMVGFCFSITVLILDGLTVTVDCSHNNMNATNIDALFTSLGTAAGAQTITVTNNPGAATCNTTIATVKGWVVAI